MMIRIIDFSVSVILLVLLTPFMLVISIVCYIDLRKPLFIQQRVGKSEKIFRLYKFRTMRVGTESIGTHLASPKAVTKVGRFLRTCKIDELPQLLNVIFGDMSLVGPRPCLPNQAEVINARKKRNVFKVRPGITGLAQLREIDMSTPELLARIDQEMIESLSFVNYMSYILRTVSGGGRGDRVREVEDSC